MVRVGGDNITGEERFLDLGARMRRLRLERGLTQAQLAEPDYTFAYVSTIEAGRRTPSRAALEYFAGKLGIDADELQTGRSPSDELELMAEYVKARALLAAQDEEKRLSAEKNLRTILKKARSLRVTEVAGRAQLGLAMAAEIRNDLSAATELLKEIEKNPQTTLRTRVDAIAGRARILQSQNKSAQAAFLLREALAMLEEKKLTDPDALIRLHTSLVAAYYAENLLAKALESADIAESLSPKVKDPERLADMYLNVGIVLTKQKRFSEADKRLADAERWFDELGRVIDRADVALTRGIGLRDAGRYDEAEEALQWSLEVFAQAGATLRECRALVALGTNARLKGEVDEARFHLKRTLTIAGEEKGVIGIAHRELGLCEADEKKAVKEIRKAIEILKEGGNERELANTYIALGNVLSRKDPDNPIAQAYRSAAEVMMQVA